MSNLQGQNFAGYEILAKLGQGGMGAVFKARQPKLDRLAALKIMASELANDPDFVARFKREAAAAANLSHPNIVQVYTAGESEGTHYIAMEFVDGETVKQHIESQGRLDPREAIAITVFVAEALQYGWNKAKLIHRDIKPDNIFLSKTGEVKVGDLGLAKTVGGATTNLTQTGTMMGSPHYISPEQARGAGDIDFHTDIYSLGCTLYHMLTGRPPYEGPDPLSVITKHVNDPPPAIFKSWPGCPVPLALVLGRMLAKRPHERPASYEDLIEQLRGVHDKLKPIVAAMPANTLGPTQVLPTPAPAPAPAPAQATSKPMVAKVATARSATAVKGKPGIGKWSLVIGGVAAAVAVIAGAVWWFANPKIETKVLDLDNGVTMSLSVIPPGKFLLGSTKEERQWVASSSKSQNWPEFEGREPRKAEIKQPFWIGQTEVTVAQWRQFANARHYLTEAEKKGTTPAPTEPQKMMGPAGTGDWQHPKAGLMPTDNQAATWLSWNDAVAFCKWLDGRERDAGRLPAGWVVRLPTEAEWEHACRAGTGTKFWWGDSEEDGKDRLNKAGDDDGFGFIAPVDSFGPRGRNRFGLADMLGNAREWCLDECDEDGAHGEMWVGNPGWHVQKGGCAFRGLTVARCAFREKCRRNYRAACTGFRIAVGPEPMAEYEAFVAPRGGPGSRRGTTPTRVAEDASGFVSLFNGRDLTGWKPRDGKSADSWEVQDGALVSTKLASYLVHEKEFEDFEMHCEFKLGRGADGGIYLRGIYQIQLKDDASLPLNWESSGGIWQQTAPSENAIKPPDEWQTLDATVASDRVTVVLNGRTVIDNAELKGPTKLALSLASNRIGPIMLQGQRGVVAYRNIRVKPLGTATTTTTDAAQQPRQTIDLLAITDPVKDRIKVERGASHSKANAWERRGAALAYASDGGSGKLAPPVAINARTYEIEVEFERLSGPGRFHVDLPIDAMHIIPMNLDNPNIKMINTRVGNPWPANRGTRSKVIVRLERGETGPQCRVTVQLDGEWVADWRGNENNVAQTGEPHPDFPGQPVTSIYIHKDSYEVHTWQLRIFDGEVKVLRGGDVTPAAAISTAVAPFDAAQARQHQEAWAKHLGVPVEMTNSIGMKFALIPPGEFLMGSTPEERDRAIEEANKVLKNNRFYPDRIPTEVPQHRVRITKPFYLGVFEVTQEEYEQLTGKNPSQFSAKGKQAAKVASMDTRRFPVEEVPFDDARDFAARLSERAQEKSAGWRYRLPTEAEWEYACRAGTATRYYFGDNASPIGDYAWFHYNGDRRTHPVGQKKPNSWGLYDMLGNTMEWCEDWFSPTYYAESPADDPPGPATGASRVERGGMLNLYAVGCRCAFRQFHDSNQTVYNWPGFRLVCEIPTAAGQKPTAASSTSFAPAADGWQNAINLLPLIDPMQDATSGKWEVVPDGLKATDIKSMSQKIQPPYRPSEEYDYRVSFTPVSGNADVAIGLTAKGRSFVFYMKKFRDDHCLGFEAISGKNIAGGPTAHRFPHLEAGSRYTVVIEVRKNNLRGYLDGKLVAEWATDYSDMSPWPVWRFKDDTLPGFGCSVSTVVFQEVKLREVTGKGTFTRTPPQTK